jgi:hypothetical protein
MNIAGNYKRAVSGVALMLALNLLPLVLAGQETRSELFPQLRGHQVRVHVASLGRRSGHVDSATVDTLFLADPSGTQVYARSAIDSIWVQGHAARTGALVGAVVGSVPLAVAAVGACESADNPSGVVGCGVLGGVLGGIAGALLGATVGTLIHRWTLRYPPRLALTPPSTLNGRPGLGVALRFPL